VSWNPSLHPRDPAGTPEGGEFRSATGWLHKLIGSTDRSGRAHGEDLRASGKLDYTAARARGRAEGYHTDGVLMHILHQQGFDGPPKVSTKEEMDRAEAAGWIPMYRKVGNTPEEGTQYTEQYRTGPMFVGLGGYANGVYAMPEWRRSSAGGYGEGELHIALAPDARTIGIRELYAQMQVQGYQQWNRNQPENPDEVEALTDAGRWAAAHGYDAIQIGGEKGSGDLMGNPDENPILEWVILNRTATMVQEA
jgi:hypothetical protein